MARKRNPRPWSDQDVSDLFHMRDVLRMTFPKIDKALNRSPKSACAKYRAMREGRALGEKIKVRSHDGVMRVPVKILVAREARLNLEHASITAALFGDPLPGRSALDQKRAANSAFSFSTAPAGSRPTMEA